MKRFSQILVSATVTFARAPRAAQVGMILFFTAAVADGILMPFFALWAHKDAATTSRCWRAASWITAITPLYADAGGTLTASGIGLLFAYASALGVVLQMAGPTSTEAPEEIYSTKRIGRTASPDDEHVND